MRKLLQFWLVLLIIVGDVATVQAANNGDEVISGDNYEITIPSEFKTMDLVEFTENYYNKTMSQIEYYNNNPDAAQKYFEDNPDEVAEVEEELEGRDIETYVSDAKANYTEFVELVETNDIDMTFAFDMNIDLFDSYFVIFNMDVPEAIVLNDDYSGSLSSNSEEWNLIDVDKEAEENFSSKSLELAIGCLEDDGSSAKLVSSEIMRFQNDNNVEMVEIILNATPDKYNDTNSRVTVYSTVVSGELFVFWYRDFNSSDVEDNTTCSEIMGSLKFHEVNREDILFMEPAMFVKTVAIEILLMIIVLIIIIFRRKSKRKSKFNVAEPQFEVPDQNEEQLSFDFDSIEVSQDKSESTDDPINHGNERK